MRSCTNSAKACTSRSRTLAIVKGEFRMRSARNVIFAIALIQSMVHGYASGQAQGQTPGQPPSQPPSHDAANPHADVERAAEPLYFTAVKAAKQAEGLANAQTRKIVLDAIEAALDAGACPTRTLIEDAFLPLHTDTRYRELIRDHARQSEISMRLKGVDGEPLRVSGVVRDAAGQPIAGALVFVYHTDAKGLYNAEGMNESNPLIFGYIKTDAQGRYAYSTIRPGHYPDQNEPVEQHIHYEVTAPGYARKITRMGFADDPFWNGRRIPTWAVAVTPEQDGGSACQLDVALDGAA
jgi:hypothetical protein